MSNEATLKARADKPIVRRPEAEYVARNIDPLGYGAKRVACMTGAILKDSLTHNGTPVSAGKVCLALLDKSVESEFQFPNLNTAFAPYATIAAMRGYSPLSTPAATMVFRAVTAAVLDNRSFAQMDASGNPFANVPKATLDNGTTVKVYNGAALDTGYLMAFSHFNAGMLDRFGLARNPSFANATQAQLEQSAEACIQDTPKVTLGQCLATGIEYGIRSIPGIKAKVESVKQR
jgi:hypothetical protein